MYPLIRTSSIVKFYNELIHSYLKLKFLKEISLASPIVKFLVSVCLIVSSIIKIYSNEIHIELY